MISFRIPPVDFKPREFAARSLILPALAFAALAGASSAHPLWFDSTVTYSPDRPSTPTAAIANWDGAAFDADNVGGSGLNTDGGDGNGPANDAATFVAHDRLPQGQLFLTGSSPEGYELNSVSVRLALYTANHATGPNATAWDLTFSNGPIILAVGRVDSLTSPVVDRVQSYQCFMPGSDGNPGAGQSADGPGTWITFRLPFPVHLAPETRYAFDLSVGNNGSAHFEWLGTRADSFAGGAAYTREGTTLSLHEGDRTFALGLTPAAARPFAHPGTLHAQADLDRMAARVADGDEPWKSSFALLEASPYAQLNWNARPVATIIRGIPGNNYTRSQQDAQAIYELALRWHITGDPAYADHAVAIANAWSATLTGLDGNSNVSLAAGICGYVFAIGGDLLSTYPGWKPADRQAYRDMMMRVFYPYNFDFLWRHHDTFWREGSNTHYRLNWDTCNMASMAAIGVLCENRAVYEQALDYFHHGVGNGRIDRAAFYIHPDGLAQTEELGRDQGHNQGGWYSMLLLCQTAWNQGDNLYDADGRRVLRAIETIAKYNLGHPVEAVGHQVTTSGYETVSDANRGNLTPLYELAYNQYVNVEGVAAPYTAQAARASRPEPVPNTALHPSQVDWFGLGTLTFTRPLEKKQLPPSNLRACWSAGRIVLSWQGTAGATAYHVLRSVNGDPFTPLTEVGSDDLYTTDTQVADGNVYRYTVSATTPDGPTQPSRTLEVRQTLLERYPLAGDARDIAGGRDGTLRGGATGPPLPTAGPGGNAALRFDGVDDYVQLPAGIAEAEDLTVTAWVNWDGGADWQRIFDFGAEQETFIMAAFRGGKPLAQWTTARGANGLLMDAPAAARGKWMHVAFTLSATTATLYLDGAAVAASSLLAIPSAQRVRPLFGQPYCYLGRSIWNADPLFSGALADVRIYNYALSAGEIARIASATDENTTPTFREPIVALGDARAGEPYAARWLPAQVSELDGDPLVFAKLSGPAWLVVHGDGSVAGVPAPSDAGVNRVTVAVQDPAGKSSTATIEIKVLPHRDGIAASHALLYNLH